jgi:hypothetical protein
MLKKYNKCIYCGSRNFKREKKQVLLDNFYLKAIRTDLKISKRLIKKMKVFECKRCMILQNNPWFSESVSRKIYSNIYGQHNRSWANLINFVKKGVSPDHGSLFEILNRKIKIKNYAEFNSPFMGILLNFFSHEYKKSTKLYNNFSNYIIKYLTSRQVAGRSKKVRKLSERKSVKFLNKINLLKSRNLVRKKVNKYLFVDNTGLCWGQNDNFKSVNSKSYASELFDLKVLDLSDENKNIKIDLFGIFHTLDHTFEPNKVLNFALDISKYVIVCCHVNSNLSKQHLFSLTPNFLKYLNKKKIYTVDLTDKISKKYKSPELYFLCSRKKIKINKL